MEPGRQQATSRPLSACGPRVDSPRLICFVSAGSDDRSMAMIGSGWIDPHDTYCTYVRTYVRERATSSAAHHKLGKAIALRCVRGRRSQCKPRAGWLAGSHMQMWHKTPVWTPQGWLLVDIYTAEQKLMCERTNGPRITGRWKLISYYSVPHLGWLRWTDRVSS